MPTQVLMPALSPTMEKGNLAKWLKKEGDPIKSGDIIAEIETDKATMEVEAADEGTLGKILVAGRHRGRRREHADCGHSGRRRGQCVHQGCSRTEEGRSLSPEKEPAANKKGAGRVERSTAQPPVEERTPSRSRQSAEPNLPSPKSNPTLRCRKAPRWSP